MTLWFRLWGTLTKHKPAMLAHTSNQGSPGASKMAQLVKGLASKSADRRLIPEIDAVVGTDSGKMSSDLHTIAEARVCVHAQTYTRMC